MLLICTTYILHSITYLLHIYHMYTTYLPCASHMYCICTTNTYKINITCVPHIPNVPHMYCICTAYVPHVYHILNHVCWVLYVPHIYCICSTYLPHANHIFTLCVASHMCCIYTAYVTHVYRMCSTYVPYMYHMCTRYLPCALHPICATYIPHMYHTSTLSSVTHTWYAQQWVKDSPYIDSPLLSSTI